MILFLFIRDMYGIRNFGFKNTNEDGPLLNPENFYKVEQYLVEQYLVQQYLKLQRNPMLNFQRNFFIISNIVAPNIVAPYKIFQG